MNCGTEDKMKIKLIFLALHLLAKGLVLLLFKRLLGLCAKRGLSSAPAVFISRIYEKKLSKWSEAEKKYISFFLRRLTLGGNDNL